MKYLLLAIFLPGAAVAQSAQHEKCIRALSNLYDAKEVFDQSVDYTISEGSREEPLKDARAAAGEANQAMTAFAFALAAYCETKRP